VTRILIAEDEQRIVAFLERGLRSHGYATAAVTTGAEALAVARDEAFDLLVLDLGLPGMDGHVVLRGMRARGERMPVVILTARDEVQETVRGFEGGADDYLTKPFRFEELLVRIRARLRTDNRTDPSELRVGDLRLDLRTRRVSVDGRSVELTAREFALLETLMRHPGQVLSRGQLLSQVWGYGFEPDSNVVEVYIRYLRAKIGHRRIETVRGMGYRMEASPPPG
jgi:DNA-binding response OmpR family regulator